MITSHGVDAWSLSIAVDGDVETLKAPELTDAVARRFGGGYRTSEVIGPARNGGQKGFVSAVLLTFQCWEWLPDLSTTSVLDMTLRPTSPLEQELSTAVLRFKDGLRGSGNPVTNACTL